MLLTRRTLLRAFIGGLLVRGGSLPQFTRPTSDISLGAWTDNSGGATNLFQKIDEVTFDDADFVQSDLSSNPDELVIGLRPFADPGVNTGHTIRLRQKKSAASGDTTDLDVIVQAGDWDVHTESYDDIDDSTNAVNFTLSSAEVDEFRAHGGYATPRIKVVRRKRATITTNTGVTYTTSPSTLICDIRRPSSGGPFPVVVMVMDGTWTTNDFATPQPSAIRLSQEEGFATIILQLRVVPGAIAPAPMEDCADLIDFIVANAATYNLDATKIAFMGGSGGGHVAMFNAFGTYLTADQFGRVKCIAAASPPCDLRTMDDDGAPANTVITNFVGATEAADPALWEFFSPTFRVASDTKPILLAYGNPDSIPAAQGNRLAPILASNGVDYRMLTYAAASHGWQLIDDAATWSEIVTWLHRYLG